MYFNVYKYNIKTQSSELKNKVFILSTVRHALSTYPAYLGISSFSSPTWRHSNS